MEGYRDKWAAQLDTSDESHGCSSTAVGQPLSVQGWLFSPSLCPLPPSPQTSTFTPRHSVEASVISHLVTARLSTSLHLPLPTLKQQQRVSMELPCIKPSVHFWITWECIPCFLPKPSMLSGTKFCFCVTTVPVPVYSAHQLILVCLLMVW